jgi:CheY-like chemotaxis protein
MIWEKMNILIVDDDAISREFLGRIVASLPGCSAILAPSALDGWQILENPALVIDALLCDIVMPEHDGFWLLGKLGDLTYRQGLPVGLCSVNKQPAIIQRARALGIRHYVLKPYAAATITAKLGQMIGPAFQEAGNTETALQADRRPRHERLGLEATKYGELLATFCTACRTLRRQLLGEYHSLDLVRAAALCTAYSATATNLEHGELAGMLRAIGVALDQEALARRRLQSVLSGSGIAAAMESLRLSLNQVQGSDPEAVLEAVSAAPAAGASPLPAVATAVPA